MAGLYRRPTIVNGPMPPAPDVSGPGTSRFLPRMHKDAGARPKGRHDGELQPG